MEILIIVACSIVSSWFFTASIQSNDTFKELFVWTGLLSCIAIWISIFIYSIRENVTASAGIGLMIGAMWPTTAKKYASKILDNLSKKKTK